MAVWSEVLDETPERNRRGQAERNGMFEVDVAVQMTFPTRKTSPEQVNDFLTWLRVEAIARRSQLTPTPLPPPP